MAIKTPEWASRIGAFPTARGWEVHRPKGRTELIKAAKFSGAEIAEWHGHEAAEPAPVVQTLHEAPMVEREVTQAEVEWHHGHEEEVEVVRQASAPLHHSGEWDEE